MSTATHFPFCAQKLALAGGLCVFTLQDAVLPRAVVISALGATYDPQIVRRTGQISRRKSRSKGSSLLEVLIAILVTAIALLGLAKLQAVGLKYNQTSSLRGFATMQAYDMADRMRANLDAVYVGSYDNVTTAAGTDPACYPSTGCSKENIVLHDIYAWNTANAALLPGGGGTVTHSATAPFIITVSWTEKCGTGEAGCSTGGTVSRNFATSLQL